MSTRFSGAFKRITFTLMLLGFSSLSFAQAKDSDTCAILGYAGIDVDQMQIPRTGLYNPLLENLFGVKVETAGKPALYKGCQFIQGPVSTFGGPNDKTITPEEIAALTGEQLRMLNNPLNPTPDVLAQNLDRYYYAAMRIKYSDETIKKWQTARLLVVNPKTGAMVSLRIVDWGPGPAAGNRLIDMSPEALHDLGLHTDEQPEVAFGLSAMPLGVVSQNSAGFDVP